MKIENMRTPQNQGDWGKVKAFFDVSVNGFSIKGFKLVDGINGLFVSMPSRQGTDDQGNVKYYDNVWIESKEIRQQLNDTAIEKYKSSSEEAPEFSDTVHYDEEPVSQNTMSSDPTPETGSNLTQDSPAEDVTTDSTTPEKQNNNAENVKQFSDDDLPF